MCRSCKWGPFNVGDSWDCLGRDVKLAIQETCCSKMDLKALSCIKVLTFKWVYFPLYPIN